MSTGNLGGYQRSSRPTRGSKLPKPASRQDTSISLETEGTPRSSRASPSLIPTFRRSNGDRGKTNARGRGTRISNRSRSEDLRTKRGGGGVRGFDRSLRRSGIPQPIDSPSKPKASGTRHGAGNNVDQLIRRFSIKKSPNSMHRGQESKPVVVKDPRASPSSIPSPELRPSREGIVRSQSFERLIKQFSSLKRQDSQSKIPAPGGPVHLSRSKSEMHDRRRSVKSGSAIRRLANSRTRSMDACSKNKTSRDAVDRLGDYLNDLGPKSNDADEDRSGEELLGKILHGGHVKKLGKRFSKSLPVDRTPRLTGSWSGKNNGRLLASRLPGTHGGHERMSSADGSILLSSRGSWASDERGITESTVDDHSEWDAGNASKSVRASISPCAVDLVFAQETATDQDSTVTTDQCERPDSRTTGKASQTSTSPFSGHDTHDEHGRFIIPPFDDHLARLVEIMDPASVKSRKGSANLQEIGTSVDNLVRQLSGKQCKKKNKAIAVDLKRSMSSSELHDIHKRINWHVDIGMVPDFEAQTTKSEGVYEGVTIDCLQQEALEITIPLPASQESCGDTPIHNTVDKKRCNKDEVELDVVTIVRYREELQDRPVVLVVNASCNGKLEIVWNVWVGPEDQAEQEQDIVDTASVESIQVVTSVQTTDENLGQDVTLELDASEPGMVQIVWTVVSPSQTTAKESASDVRVLTSIVHCVCETIAFHIVALDNNVLEVQWTIPFEPMAIVEESPYENAQDVDDVKVVTYVVYADDIDVVNLELVVVNDHVLEIRWTVPTVPSQILGDRSLDLLVKTCILTLHEDLGQDVLLELNGLEEGVLEIMWFISKPIQEHARDMDDAEVVTSVDYAEDIDVDNSDQDLAVVHDNTLETQRTGPTFPSETLEDVSSHVKVITSVLTLHEDLGQDVLLELNGWQEGVLEIIWLISEPQVAVDDVEVVTSITYTYSDVASNVNVDLVALDDNVLEVQWMIPIVAVAVVEPDVTVNTLLKAGDWEEFGQDVLLDLHMSGEGTLEIIWTVCTAPKTTVDDSLHDVEVVTSVVHADSHVGEDVSLDLVVVDGNVLEIQWTVPPLVVEGVEEIIPEVEVVTSVQTVDEDLGQDVFLELDASNSGCLEIIWWISAPACQSADSMDDVQVVTSMQTTDEELGEDVFVDIDASQAGVLEIIWTVCTAPKTTVDESLHDVEVITSVVHADSHVGEDVRLDLVVVDGNVLEIQWTVPPLVVETVEVVTSVQTVDEDLGQDVFLELDASQEGMLHILWTISTPPEMEEWETMNDVEVTTSVLHTDSDAGENVGLNIVASGDNAVCVVWTIPKAPTGIAGEIVTDVQVVTLMVYSDADNGEDVRLDLAVVDDNVLEIQWTIPTVPVEVVEEIASDLKVVTLVKTVVEGNAEQDVSLELNGSEEGVLEIVWTVSVCPPQSTNCMDDVHVTTSVAHAASDVGENIAFDIVALDDNVLELQWTVPLVLEEVVEEIVPDVQVVTSMQRTEEELGQDVFLDINASKAGILEIIWLISTPPQATVQQIIPDVEVVTSVVHADSHVGEDVSLDLVVVDDNVLEIQWMIPTVVVEAVEEVIPEVEVVTSMQTVDGDEDRDVSLEISAFTPNVVDIVWTIPVCTSGDQYSDSIEEEVDVGTLEPVHEEEIDVSVTSNNSQIDMTIPQDDVTDVEEFKFKGREGTDCSTCQAATVDVETSVTYIEKSEEECETSVQLLMEARGPNFLHIKWVVCEGVPHQSATKSNNINNGNVFKRWHTVEEERSGDKAGNSAGSGPRVVHAHSPSIEENKERSVQEINDWTLKHMGSTVDAVDVSRRIESVQSGMAGIEHGSGRDSQQAELHDNRMPKPESENAGRKKRRSKLREKVGCFFCFRPKF